MLKALIRVRMAALGSWFTGSARNGGKPSKGKLIGFSLLMLYSFGAIGFMFWHYFSAIAEPFYALKLEWLYFAMTGITAFSLMFVGSVFFAKAQLYEARDNELLLSMPIAPGSILLSRVVMLLVICVCFGLPAIVPAMVIALREFELGAGQTVSMAVLFLLLPVFTLSLSALFGWLLSVLTARVKHKALFGTILCIAAILGYSYLIMKVNTSIMDIASHAGGIAKALGGVAPVYWFGVAMAEGRLSYTLILCAIFVAVAALTYALLSATFIRTATTRRGFNKVRYVERKSAVASPEAALLRREFNRLGSSSAYIMNAGMGVIFLLIGTAALLIKRSAVIELLAANPELGGLLPPLLVLGLCAMASMNLISAPAVSLEGKNIWIVQSLPVETSQVLRAKLKVHLIVCLPAVLLASCAVLTVIKLTAVQTALLLLLPAAMTVFVGLLGLAENLRHPNLDWSNEAQAVKTGFGLLFTMLISWAVIAAGALAVYLIGLDTGFVPVALTFFALLAAASVFLWRWLETKGAELFMQL